MNFDPHDPANWEEDQGPSRTQKKKEMKSLQVMGEKLAALPRSVLERMPLPPGLLKAILDTPPAKKREARRRHMQYLGKLMREVDAEPIAEALGDLEDGRRADADAFHLLEEIRNSLMDCDQADLPETLERVLERFPHADRTRLGQLARSARAERRAAKPPKSFRALFRYLRELSGEGG